MQCCRHLTLIAALFGWRNAVGRMAHHCLRQSTVAMRYSACNGLTGYRSTSTPNRQYSSDRYSENLSLLLALMRALPVLVWHRQNWNILRPYVLQPTHH